MTLTLEQLQQHLEVLRKQALRIEGGIQTLLQLIAPLEQDAAKIAADVKD